MPMPEGAQLNFGYNPLLTNIGLNLLPKLDQYIGRKIFRSIPVASPVGTYNQWDADDFLRRQGKEIANYEAVPLGGFTTSQKTFSAKNWGVGTPYTNVDLANARRGGMSDQQFRNNKARWVTTQGVIEQEFRIRDFVQTAANWTLTLAGVTSAPDGTTTFLGWDQASATPVDDVKLWKRRMRLLSGREPNTAIIPESIMLALYKNAQILDRVKTAHFGDGKPFDVEKKHVEALLGLTIYEPKGVYNSAKEGQTKNFQDIWNQDIVWIGYVNDNPSFDDPSCGYLFNWTGSTTDGLPPGIAAGQGPAMMGAVENDEGLFIREYPDMARGAMVIEGMLWASPNVVCADMGMTLTNVLAS